MSKAGIQLDQYVAVCMFGGSDCDITRDFRRLFHPYYFNCYTYNDPLSAAATQTGNKMPWSAPGLNSGLSVVVLTGSGMVTRNDVARMLPGLYDTGTATAGADGVRVIVHPPSVLPLPLEEGFDVPPGFSVSLGVRPKRNVRIGLPYGDCVDHNPLFNRTGTGNDSDGYHVTYRQVVCQQMCTQKYVTQECGCLDETLPSLLGVDLPPCRSSDHFPVTCSHHVDEHCIDALLVQHRRVRCVS